MSSHTIAWCRAETEHEVTFEYRAGRPAAMYDRNGDPGWPADPDEIEVISVTPGAPSLLDEAQNWLESEGLDEAMSIVVADQDAAREYAAEMRDER